MNEEGSIMDVRTEVDEIIANDDDDFFGASVSISGDGNTVFVGVPYGSNEKDIGTGSAYIYTRNGSTWTQQSKLLANDGVASDNFGYSLAISGDGNTAIVGAYYDNSGRGSAYIYTRTNGTWAQQSKLIASDAADNDYFGYSVSISSDGNTAIVGAYNDDGGGGSAYIYTRTNGEWTEQVKLLASDGSTNDNFGWSVSISSDGNTAIVGAYIDDNERGTDAGSAYIYTRSGTTWTQQSKLLASDGADTDQFGVSVSISSDGNTAIVGAYNDGGTRGSAHIYTRTDGTWIEQTKIVASDGGRGEYFGQSVSISSDGNTAIVGSIGDGRYRGSAYIYTRINGKWTEQSKLLASNGTGSDYFGYSVSISSDGNTAIVGAHLDDGVRGSVYIFDLT